MGKGFVYQLQQGNRNEGVSLIKGILKGKRLRGAHGCQAHYMTGDSPAFNLLCCSFCGVSAPDSGTGKKIKLFDC